MHRLEAIGIASLLIVMGYGWQGAQIVGIIIGCLILAKICEVK